MRVVVGTDNDKTLQLDVTGEWDIEQDFLVSIAVHVLKTICICVRWWSNCNESVPNYRAEVQS